MSIERRVVAGAFELRAATEDQPQTLAGYAAVFNRDTVIAGLFRERIAPDAFSRAIKEDDVRALFNHDPNFVLGRTTAGTLALTQDETGLRYEADTPDTQWARDLMVSVARGDVNQSSFGFQVVREEWKEPENRAELPTRTIIEARLFDVSVVTYPAYEETTAEARSRAAEIADPAVDPDPGDVNDHAQMLIRQKRQDIIEGTL